MDVVYQAITALYDNPDVNEKEKASKWLGDIQKSIHSWKVADELLRDKKSMHSYYFGAQTMRAKVQHNLKELNTEVIPLLRDSLINHLYTTTPDISGTILTQLSLALADLALQMPSWDDCVGDLMKKFSNGYSHALTEFLTVLPQEVASSNLRLGENRRHEMKAILHHNSAAVFKYLNDNIVNAQGSEVALKIVRCLTSWIQLTALELRDVPHNAVIRFTLQVLSEFNSNNTLHESAADCISCLLHSMDYVNENEQVERLLVESILSLENAYHMAVAHEEEEKVSTYAKLFTELAETYLSKIVDHAVNGNTHFALPSLELLLVCCGYHDYEVAAVTFRVWHMLSEDLYSREQTALTETFSPYIQRLLTSLARHCQCEPDNTTLPDEDDDFHDFRMNVMELIKDVVFIVGSSSVFKQMFAALHQDLGWEQTEAALFVMQCVAKNILPDEYEVVPKVVEAILSMPEDTHNGVRATGVMLLGELCEWVERHPAAVQPTLHTLLGALTDKPRSTHAARALKNICKACRAHMTVHVTGLLELTQSLDSMGLLESANTDVINGLAATIGSLPSAQMKEAMKQAVGIHLAPLRELIKAETAHVKKGSINDPVKYIDRIASLFREVDAREAPLTEGEHPVLAALCDCWPVFALLLDKHKNDTRIVERTCRALRFAIRCLSIHATPLINPLANKMADVYSSFGHSCILYLMSVLVDELSKIPEALHTLLQLINALMPQALSLLMEQRGPTEHPDTIDDLFRLSVRFLQRAPREFLSSPCMCGVLRGAVLSCAVDHRDANASLMKFLMDLVTLAKSNKPQINDLTSSLLMTYGEELVYSLLEASVLHLHSYMLGEVGEVIYELMQWNLQTVTKWLENSIPKLPQHSPGPSHGQDTEFYNTLIRAKTCKKVITALKDFARLYR